MSRSSITFYPSTAVGGGISMGGSWSPAGLPGLKGWYDAADALNASALPCAYLDAVASWPDRSGLGYHAAQVTAGLRPAALPCRTGAPHYLHCPGVGGNGVSVPDSAALDITAEIVMEYQISVPVYPPAARAIIGGKWAAPSDRSYLFSLETTGRLAFSSSAGGTAIDGTASSTANPAITAGVPVWVRASRSTGGIITFASSADGITWTQVGATVASGQATAIYSGAAAVTVDIIGTVLGQVFRNRIFADVARTDLRLDLDFTAVPHRAASFVCATGQTATLVTSGANPATVVGTSMIRFDGVDDLLSLPAGALPGFKSAACGYLLAGVCGNQLTAGNASQAALFYSTGTNAANARIGIYTRFPTNTFAGSARETDAGAAISATTAVTTGSKVMTAEALWGSAIRLRVDGAQAATTALAAQSSPTDSLAASIGGASGACAACDISGIITAAPATVWTATQRSQAERYLGLPLGKNIPLV